jgi:hypothetical protein
MTEREIETVWRTQPAPVVADEATWRWMQKVRRGRAVTTGVVAAILLGATVLLLRLSLLFTDPDHTLANSSIDLLLAAVPLAGGLMHLKGRLRQRRDVRALEDQTRAYVDYLIERTRSEVHDSNRVMPGVLAAVILAVAIAKWQSVAGGRESLDNALGGLAVAVVMCVIGGAAAWHWTESFARPRLESLLEIRREFDE